MYSQTQLFGRLRLVMRRTLFADLAMGMAQHTTRGVVLPFVLLLIVRAYTCKYILYVVRVYRRETRDEWVGGGGDGQRGEPSRGVLTSYRFDSFG